MTTRQQHDLVDCFGLGRLHAIPRSVMVSDRTARFDLPSRYTFSNLGTEREEATRDLLDALGHADAERIGPAWQRVCLLFGRYCEPYLSLTPRLAGATTEELLPEIARDRHDCTRGYGWSIFAASHCDGCALSFLRAGGDIVGLARACTGMLRGFRVEPPERSGIAYEGPPTEEQRERALRLWRELHGATEAK